MNYKTCSKIIKILLVIGVVSLAVAFIVKSMALLVLGFTFTLIVFPIKLIWWKCPFCGEKLPWGKKKKKNYPYRCPKCGNEIRLPD